MDGWGSNPFGILTFIVAPAIMTNASSVMALGTSNRFARTIDRVRALSAQIEGKDHDADPEIAMWLRQLQVTQRRILLLVRALTSLYVSVGSFAAASLVSLLGAIFAVAHHELLQHAALLAALCAGLAGVGGLVTGSALVVWETRLALRILRDETEFLLRRAPRQQAASATAESIRPASPGGQA
jgi:hypothetical protein